MTTDRAVRLGQKVATVILTGGPYSEAALESRITNQVAELLLAIDWRVLPEDERERQDHELFSGQMGLGI